MVPQREYIMCGIFIADVLIEELLIGVTRDAFLWFVSSNSPLDYTAPGSEVTHQTA